jgi:Skp family chaperone for outer membrane proteins
MRFAPHLAATAVAFSVAASAAHAQAAPAAPKFAYINSRTVLEQAPAAAAAQAQLQREMQPYEAQVKRMSDSLQTMIGDYQKSQATLTAAQRETRETAIRTKQTEYAQRTQKMQDDAQKREAAVVQPIMEQIRTVIEDVRQRGGYAMIFDVASSNGFVVAADKSLDLTPQVVERVKALKPAATAPAAAPARGATAAPAGVTRPKTPTQ